MKKHLSIFLLLLSLVACTGIKMQEIQNIDVSCYADLEKDTFLTKGLMYLNHSYLIEKIPSLNEENIKGLRLGWFVRDSDKKPFYRVIYNLNDASVKASLEQLKSDFETYLPEVAKLCALDEEEIEEKEKFALESIELFLSKDFDGFWERMEPITPITSKEELLPQLNLLADSYGTMKERKLFYLHKYDEMHGVPNVYSLAFEANFEKIEKAYVIMNLRYDISEPKIGGFTFNAPQK